MYNATLLCWISMWWVVMLSARSFDDAVQCLYTDKPYLRPLHECHVIAQEEVYQSSHALYIEWDSMHWCVDFIALAYVGLYGYAIYNNLYSIDQPWLGVLCNEYVLLSWIKHCGLCGTFIISMLPLVIKAYVYRMLAHWGLSAVRYGIAMPIAWICKQLKEHNKHENFSRYRIAQYD